ncbi:MAG: UDP-3-O-(3-hydroxymyristoyl)glucosamine N-acyltransferase [Proteobacteria bacterium]|nr:UDP-3-O-(3-hydroxymyristoyl)glucosamine N-acyltransferase [Pseudomonadota bacterium]MBU1711112.1 UDP-3-O-(3-hydroxymyristoyl)glucosamine N-acyltransferase [Pseudomonadota bacterium]
MKSKSLQELSELVGGEISGDPAVLINNLADFDTSGPGDITYLVKAKNIEKLDEIAATAVIVPLSIEKSAKPLIRVRDPNLAATIIHNYLLKESFHAFGVHPKAHLGKDCIIPEQVSIGPMAVIGDRVKIGKRVTIHPGVVLGDEVEIGEDTELHANVSVEKGCKIGSRVIINNNTVVGSEGFGYATDERGRHIKRPHVGTVQIDDDVEVGANVCIDRGTFGKTWIKQGTKIDNLVQVAHNVVIGEGCLIVAQSGFAGSVTLGSHVIIGGQSAVRDHIKVGNRAMVAGKSGVSSDVEDGAVVSGFPAIPHKQWLRAATAFVRIPDLIKNLHALQKKVDALLLNNQTHEDTKDE